MMGLLLFLIGSADLAVQVKNRLEGEGSLNPAWPSTWSNDGDRQARDGSPSCAIMPQTLPPWCPSVNPILLVVDRESEVLLAELCRQRCSPSRRGHRLKGASAQF